ncbi:hypothetical protein KYB31_07850 [Clostridium felsineum]|uniref:hypothetical protein n=1 Tax=Clostridium felsineum TaxID=36839 RepID=UPI00214D9906|nr:hypothetical protein [Clostridium felsineum]MCR3758902.1 hypothetical protein [Clostridium felsineum]
MCFYIGIEDLAANALIETLRKSERRFLTYNEIENYGSKVIGILNDKGEKAVLILSRESTNELFRNYSEYFEEKNENGIKGIALRKDKEINDLIEQFRGYLSLDVLRAFINEESVRVLVH